MVLYDIYTQTILLHFISCHLRLIWIIFLLFVYFATRLPTSTSTLAHVLMQDSKGIGPLMNSGR